MGKTKKTIRDFGNGAIRDIGDGKFDYYGFRHPLIEQSFAKYMNDHRKMADGSLRDANNWWGGWDKEISLQSMLRHVEDLQAIHAGFIVFETRDEMGVHKEYVKNIDEANDMVKLWKQMKVDFRWIDSEDCLNAIRFNSGAYLLQELKN